MYGSFENLFSYVWLHPPKKLYQNRKTTSMGGFLLQRGFVDAQIFVAQCLRWQGHAWRMAGTCMSVCCCRSVLSNSGLWVSFENLFPFHKYLLQGAAGFHSLTERPNDCAVASMCPVRVTT